MKSEDKLNLTKVYLSGRLLNDEKTNIGLPLIHKSAKKIPFLAKYYDRTDQELRIEFIRNVSRDILTNINNLDGRREFYTKTGVKDKYIPFEERFGTLEAYERDQFAANINRAFRFSHVHSKAVKDKLIELIRLL